MKSNKLAGVPQRSCVAQHWAEYSLFDETGNFFGTGYIDKILSPI